MTGAEDLTAVGFTGAVGLTEVVFLTGAVGLTGPVGLTGAVALTSAVATGAEADDARARGGALAAIASLGGAFTGSASP